MYIFHSKLLEKHVTDAHMQDFPCWCRVTNGAKRKDDGKNNQHDLNESDLHRL